MLRWFRLAAQCSAVHPLMSCWEFTFTLLEYQETIKIFNLSFLIYLDINSFTPSMSPKHAASLSFSSSSGLVMAKLATGLQK